MKRKALLIGNSDILSYTQNLLKAAVNFSSNEEFKW